MTIEVVHWNPDRPVVPGRLGKVVPWRRPVNNFGDLLGPIIVDRLLRKNGVDPSQTRSEHRLLTVGSIMRLARDGDTVWGTGINGKSIDSPNSVTRLDVRAVRGPRTREVLASWGISAPEVYGDPGLLIGELWTREELSQGIESREFSVVPNFHDFARARGVKNVVNPRAPVEEVLRRISSSDLVVGSSLHGVVVAESLGIPARLVRSPTEPPFKYDDYYAGSGRPTYEAAADVETALALGGERPPEWDAEALLRSFPIDLWVS